MELNGDEACALKVARALSYINFSSLERWFGHPGFIKIFQGLKEEGTDTGWALLLGAIERTTAGDRHLPKDVIYRILRENKLTVQHLHDLYPDGAPVRPRLGGFRVHPAEHPPEQALSAMEAAVTGFGSGRLALDELCDELYRLHTGEMRDTLYYHALLAAKSVRHPISAHMLGKALRLLPPGALPDEAVASALARLEQFQSEHLAAAMRGDGDRGPDMHGRGPPDPMMPEASPAPGRQRTLPPVDHRERAERFLQGAGIREGRGTSSRLAALCGYDDGHLDELLEPFLLRCYCGEGAVACDGGLIMAIGPPEVDKPAILQGIAQDLGLKFMVSYYSDMSSTWMGELETELLRALERGRELSQRSRGRPVMVVFSDQWQCARPAQQAGRGGASPAEVIEALSGLLSGPRRREALGAGGKAPVIAVATASGPLGLDRALRGQVTVLRLELPGLADLERLLVRNVVGRYYLCDLDRISFSRLGEEALGLSSMDIAHVAQRAKLLALDRRARQLGTRLATAPERLRASISRSYLITQEDLSTVIAAQKQERCRSAQTPGEHPTAMVPLNHQTDLLGWEAPPWMRRPSSPRGTIVNDMTRFYAPKGRRPEAERED